MDDSNLDSMQRFTSKDGTRADLQERRTIALGLALWGRTADELQRQLLAPHPRLPAGFDLADYYELERRTANFAAVVSDSRHPWTARLGFAGIAFVVGTLRLNAWEARCELVRRAIVDLEQSS